MAVSSTDLVFQVIDALEAASIPYMLVGSYSSNFFGRSRSTKDADFVLQTTDQQMVAFSSKLGPNFKLDSQMTFESITMTSRYVISCKPSSFTIELFMLSDDAHDQLRFSRRKSVDFEGRQVFLPTAEDVVIQKIRWAKMGRRSKDVDDVKYVLAVSGPILDLAYIRHWTDVHGTRAIFEKLWAESNPDAAASPV
jgi:hypothetical protein